MHPHQEASHLFGLRMQLELDSELMELVRRGRDLASVGELTDGRDLLDRAWELAASKNHQQRCTVAHYIGIAEPDPHLKHSWNLKCLEFAAKLDTDEVNGFYASIYSNLGYSSLQLGNREEALQYYELAEEWTAMLEDDHYGQMVKTEITSTLERLRGR